MREHGVMHLVFALAFCLLAWPVIADDAGEANKLMIEAIKLMDAVDMEPSAEKKFNLLKEAYDKLTEIIERYPSTDMAVKLATGQRIGKVSLEKARKALAAARVAGSTRPGAPVRVWRHRTAVTVAAWSAKGRVALTAEVGGVAAVRDIRTGKVLHTWQHRSRVAAADVSPDGRRVLTVGVDRLAVLRSARTGRILDEWGYEGAAGAVALSPDGRRALAGLHSSVYLADIKARKVLRTWRGRAPVTSAAYSPDGRHVFMGFADGRARLGDVDTGGDALQVEASGLGWGRGDVSGLLRGRPEGVGRGREWNGRAARRREREDPARVGCRLRSPGQVRCLFAGRPVGVDGGRRSRDRAA